MVVYHMFIDAHCHFDLLDTDKAISAARKAHVTCIISNGINPETNRKTLELSKQYPEVRAALGLYPTEALALSDATIKKELAFIRSNAESIVAIGEVGMDFKEDLEHHNKQRSLFSNIIELSNSLHKPLIVHSRKAEEACIELLEKHQARQVVMHCFSGKMSLVKKIISNGWTLTIPTCVKTSEHFQNVIALTPMNQLLCETDSPYLHPDKGWPNEPAQVIESYKMIAKIKNLSLKEIEKQLEINANALFSTH